MSDEKDAAQKAKEEAAAKKAAEKEAQAQAKAEANAKRQAEKEAQAQAKAEANAKRQAEKEARMKEQQKAKEEAAAQKAAQKEARAKAKEEAAAKKAAEAPERKVRKEREPIAFFCSIILLVACVAVAGSWIYDEAIADDSGDKVISNSSVEVYYTLSFYDFYENGGPIYQTNYEKVDKSDKWVHADGYTYSEDVYKVSMANSNALQGFRDALLGHSAGDTVKIRIAAKDGYNVECDMDKIADITNISMDSTSVMTSAEFEAEYGFVPAGNVTVTTSYGWPANVTLNAGGFIVTHSPVAGTDYSMTYSGLTYALHINSVAAGVINYSVTVPEAAATQIVGDDGQMTSVYRYEGADYTAMKMMKITTNESGMNKDVLGIAYSGNVIVYKTCDPQDNQDLYFTIKIVTVS
ncbi:hypothetical protein TALC_00623 [Thermoplasmatales archaeon BRNA1]|nr:hypothetical protein TALC_00623 [Thermoplasmatales archaeon BRNA1]